MRRTLITVAIVSSLLLGGSMAWAWRGNRNRSRLKQSFSSLYHTNFAMQAYREANKAYPRASSMRELDEAATRRAPRASGD